MPIKRKKRCFAKETTYLHKAQPESTRTHTRNSNAHNLFKEERHFDRRRNAVRTVRNWKLQQQK